MLDKENLATITVEPYYEEHLGFFIRPTGLRCSDLCCDTLHMRLSESKEKEKFVELPLCLIREKYEGLAGGKDFVENLLKSSLA